MLGTTEAPHFERAAFKVDRIFVTPAGDGLSANLALTPDEQEFKCQLAPQIFQPINNAWGRKGWTSIMLANANEADSAAVLVMAHVHAVGKVRALSGSSSGAGSHCLGPRAAGR
ncbi:MmcQ/YjbR family DNA-binding protein [Devosia sp. A8/3-2]|nr:MmcQ/YjbR family DNA-binding protein [Devosia sp. A8/3-2]